MLGGGRDVAARRVDDEDAALGCSGHVDVIDADTRPADDPEALAGLQHRFGDAGLGADHQGVEGADRGDQRRLVETRPDLDLAQLAEPRQAVLGQLVRDQDPVH